MIEMHQNDLINRGGKHILEMESIPEETMVDFNGELITAFTAAQAASCRYFLEQISATACIFEDDVLHVGLPTKNNWFQTKQ